VIYGKTILNLLCFYNFALYPDYTCPSGDFFLNDLNINIDHNLTDEFARNNKNVTVEFIIKGTKFVRYYIDENGKTRCKFVRSRELNKGYRNNNNDNRIIF